MTFPVELPVAPMLAKAVAAVPADEGTPMQYEPKWDGFRVLLMRDDDVVELFGRGRKPLTRYFPEIVEWALRDLPTSVLLDGELVTTVETPAGLRLDWETLSARIHPAASRVGKLAASTPATFIAFDLLAQADEALMSQPLTERRARLERLFAEGLDRVTWARLGGRTEDPQVARHWFATFEGAGLDGVVAKPASGVYEPGKRGWLKVKHKRTAEAVVLGYRVHKSGEGVGSLLLGLAVPTPEGGHEYQHVGGIVSFPMKTRLALVAELEPWVVRDENGYAAHAERERTRFSSGKDRSFVPMRPERVVEVEFDQLEGDRFRHAVTFLRWRDDKDPASCTLDQIDRAPAYDLDEVFEAGRD